MEETLVLSQHIMPIASSLKALKIASLILLLISIQVIGLLNISSAKGSIMAEETIYAHVVRISANVEEKIYVLSADGLSIQYLVISVVEIVSVKKDATTMESAKSELESGIKWSKAKLTNLISNNFYVYGRGRVVRRSRRTKLEICAQILECLQFDLLSLNEIAFYVGLNYKAAKRYIEFLMKNNLIDALKKDGKTYYMATPSGRRFLMYFEEIKRLIKANDSSGRRRPSR